MMLIGKTWEYDWECEEEDGNDSSVLMLLACCLVVVGIRGSLFSSS